MHDNVIVILTLKDPIPYQKFWNLDAYVFQEDLKKALHYTNLLLDLVPDHPRAVGNKWYYEETLAAEGKLEEEYNKRKGNLNFE